MDKKELAQLIHLFRSGKATPEQRRLLDDYWNDAVRDNTAIDEMPEASKVAMKEEILECVRERAGLTKVKSRKLFVIPSIVYKVAASLLILIGVAAAWYAVPTAQQAVYVADLQVEIQTKYGERRTVVLPDESSVVLNGNSKLRYSNNWSPDKPREVWIDGEGFFAVQHTKNHQKFIVHTREGLNVEVLGTKFNVKTREHGSEVLLTEGKVKLNVEDKVAAAVYLNPGELATMKENKLSKKTVKDVAYTSWLNSKMVFDKMPLGDLAQILRDTYGLKVEFEDEELRKRQLSGEISSATTEDILFAIAETFNIEVTKIDDNSVTFSQKESKTK